MLRAGWDFRGRCWSLHCLSLWKYCCLLLSQLLFPSMSLPQHLISPFFLLKDMPSGVWFLTGYVHTDSYVTLLCSALCTTVFCTRSVCMSVCPMSMIFLASFSRARFKPLEAFAPFVYYPAIITIQNWCHITFQDLLLVTSKTCFWLLLRPVSGYLKLLKSISGHFNSPFFLDIIFAICHYCFQGSWMWLLA